ncbi:hypothetical protein ARMGADRAFT_471175 [Armillaria gallica]|uniref:Uncharacterized protein n=1 Tax=Armillaria gallica TaxID=47427 RepID=A0A2H3DF59_ARMGA|nr:hypothetical protein ARMGADRAFT_471175 [Armillaria gallica]
MFGWISRAERLFSRGTMYLGHNKACNRRIHAAQSCSDYPSSWIGITAPEGGELDPLARPNLSRICFRPWTSKR